MTSKRLFFKAMKEDLRHKLWMIALSCLASFLAHPVMWLMAREGVREYIALLGREGFNAREQVQTALSLCSRDLLITGGAVAAAGAFIVGLFGFRFLFRKSSVDTYHSLPVKRRTLFAVCYLDGFLIWFIPSFVCTLGIPVILGGVFGEAGGMWAMIQMMKLISAFHLFASLLFLLVYNLVLVAVMLSGNVLNTLVSMMILGCGAIAVWGLATGFFGIYMATFYQRSWGLRPAVYASPLISALTMIYSAAQLTGRGYMGLGYPEARVMIAVNLAVTILLGLCAWFLYQRRESEHAEQGIRSKGAAAVMKIVSGIGAGMCGWLIFTLLVEEEVPVWGCFGAVLAGGLVFGILDIIFQMEFKAFFAHKLQMAGTLLATLLICLAFYQDWPGYDTYLPEKDEIAEIGIYHYEFANRRFSMDEENGEYPLDWIHLKNTEDIYTYLECVTARQRENADTFLFRQPSRQIRTKVTLKNGGSYYRVYTLLKQDREVLLPLLTDEAYLEQTYQLKEDIQENLNYKIIVNRGDSRFGIEQADPDMIRSIIKAYNQDLLENSERIITGRGRILARVSIEPMNDVVMDIYEFMDRTVEALNQAGFGKWLGLMEASEISCLELGLEYGYEEDLLLAARLTYGVYGDETREELEERYRKAQEAYYSDDNIEEDWEITEETVGDEGQGSLLIREQAEIEELLELISYGIPGRGYNLFQEEYVRIGITDKNGKSIAGYIEMGKLPEKYILRFGELYY